MGGGTPLIEANRLGCDIIGYDINPIVSRVSACRKPAPSEKRYYLSGMR